MLGRMSPEWASAQQSYYDWLGRRKTGRRWLVALTVKMLNLSWDMWDHRNKILHASTHPWNLIKIRAADQQIEDEYERGQQNLLIKDYKWLKQSLQTTKKLPFETKLQWIESVRLARLRFVSDTRTHFRSFCSERRTIARWMATASMADQGSNEGNAT